MPRNHTVRPSDTLAVIAREFDLRYPELIADWPGNRGKLPAATRRRPAPYIKPAPQTELEIPEPQELQPSRVETDQRHVYRVLGPKLLHMISIDGHMHIQSINCTPLPLQYGVIKDRAPTTRFVFALFEGLTGASVMVRLLPPELIPRWLRPSNWRVVALVGLLTRVPNRALITVFNMIKMRRFATLGSKPTSWIGRRHVRYSRAAARSALTVDELEALPRAGKSIRLEPNDGTSPTIGDDDTTYLSVRERGEILAISVALTMDMDLAHVDGYYGEPIYRHNPLLGTHYRLRTSGALPRHLRPYIPVNNALEDNPISPLMTQLRGMDLGKAVRLGRHVSGRLGDLRARRAEGKPMLGLGIDSGPSSDFFHGAELVGAEVLNNLKRFKQPELALFMSYESWQQQLWHTEKALVSAPFRLFALLHYDPRRILHDASKLPASAPVSSPLDALASDQAPAPDRMDATIVEPFERIVGGSPEGIYLGFKLYTSQGYMPADPVGPIAAIQRKFYAQCIEQDLPLMNHCVPGGYFTHQRRYYLGWFTKQARRGFSRRDTVALDHDWNDIARSLPLERSPLDPRSIHELGFFYDHFVHPDAWGKLLRKPAYSKLRVCLAHFAADDQLWRDDPDDWQDKDLPEDEFIALKQRIFDYLSDLDQRWSGLRKVTLAELRGGEQYQAVLNEIVAAQDAINALDRKTGAPCGAEHEEIKLLSIRADERSDGQIYRYRYSYRPLVRQILKGGPSTRVSIVRWALEQVWSAEAERYEQYSKPVFDDNGIIYRRSWLRAIAELCRDHKNCHVDISYLRLSEHEANKNDYRPLQNWQTLGKILKRFPTLVKKILFGSDWYVYKTSGGTSQKFWYTRYYHQALEGMMRLQRDFMGPGPGSLAGQLECDNLFVQWAVLNPLRFYGLTAQTERAQQMYDALRLRLERQYTGPPLEKRRAEMDRDYGTLQAIIQNLT